MKKDGKYKISAERIKEVRENTVSTLPPEIGTDGKPKRRKKKTLTQKDLAQLVQCDSNYISMLESGDYPLNFEMAYKISGVCNVSPEYLLGKTDNKHYRGDVELAISKMQQYANMVDQFIEYISMSSGHKKCPLSEEEQKAFFNDVEWYAIARLNRMVTEKKGDKDNAKESK